MGPTEKAINVNVEKLQGAPITSENLMMLAVLANQQVLARALDKLGPVWFTNWERQDFST